MHNDNLTLAVTQQPKTTQAVFERMLGLIHARQWTIGQAIPSERVLTAQFNVSRVVVREALSMLRSLGVLETEHGIGSKIRGLGADFFARLLPLAVSLDVQSTCKHLFEVRIALEPPAAHLAALNRSDQDLSRLTELCKKLRKQERKKPPDRNRAQSSQTDLQFHLQIARASGNSLFPALLNVISGHIVETCNSEVPRMEFAPSIARTIHAHEVILEAIRLRKPDLAQAEMEAHLRYSAALPRSVT